MWFEHHCTLFQKLSSRATLYFKILWFLFLNKPKVWLHNSKESRLCFQVPSYRTFQNPSSTQLFSTRNRTLYWINKKRLRLRRTTSEKSEQTPIEERTEKKLPQQIYHWPNKTQRESCKQSLKYQTQHETLPLKRKLSQRQLVRTRSLKQ